MVLNPFRPSFGVTPPLLVGRDAEVLAFGDSLDAGPARPGAQRCTPASVASARQSC